MALVKLGVTPRGSPSICMTTVGLGGVDTSDRTMMLTLPVSPAGRTSQCGEALTLNFWFESIIWNSKWPLRSSGGIPTTTSTGYIPGPVAWPKAVEGTVNTPENDPSSAVVMALLSMLVLAKVRLATEVLAENPVPAKVTVSPT